MRTVAARRNGGWVINGSKNFITNATFAETTVALAITDRTAGTHGISAFIIERGDERVLDREEREQARHARERHGCDRL